MPPWPCRTPSGATAEEVRRTHGLEMQLRVGLNSGEVVVRAIGNDLHMDYSAVGQTTHLAARMEQLAPRGTFGDGRPATGGGVGPGYPLGAGARQGAARARGGLRAGGRRPGRAPAGICGAGADPLCGAAAELAVLHQALDRLGLDMARPWRSSGNLGSVSPVCSTSLSIRRAPRAGCCWKAARSPMARPLPICQSSTCLRATVSSRTATTRGASARSLPGGC